MTDKKPKRNTFNKRQMAMHTKLRKLGFVPVVWQRKDGSVWIEEQASGPFPFAVDTSHGETVMASVKTVEKAIGEAIKSDVEMTAQAEAARAVAVAVKKCRTP